MTEPGPSQGLVLRIDAKVCHVEVDGQRLTLPLAGKLFEERSHEKRPLAVGDRVLLDPTGSAIDVLLPGNTVQGLYGSAGGSVRQSQGSLLA